MLIQMIKGVYMILTFHMYIDQYEGKNLAGYEISQRSLTSSSTNIDKAYAYRDSKMAGMSPDKTADLYIRSSKLGSSSGNRHVDGYINSKLGGYVS
jgi:hypothetical protein